MNTAQEQFVDFIFRNYIDKGKKYLGIALDRDSDVYRIPYFALAKSPGALKTLFKRSRYDMKDLTIYELVESVDFVKGYLAAVTGDNWQEICRIAEKLCEIIKTKKELLITYEVDCGHSHSYVTQEINH